MKDWILLITNKCYTIIYNNNTENNNMFFQQDNAIIYIASYIKLLKYIKYIKIFYILLLWSTFSLENLWCILAKP